MRRLQRIVSLGEPLSDLPDLGSESQPLSDGTFTDATVRYERQGCESQPFSDGTFSETRDRHGRRKYSSVKQQERDARLQELACATATLGLAMRERGVCKLEESVYGAAVLMPQLARTVGWNKKFTTFVARSAFFLLLNITLQGYLLEMITKEEKVMDLFGGQMYLCDFGINMDNCPGPGCRGPGGTDITPARLYDWESIVSRNFVKDSLKALFPEKSKEIDEQVDPGEYGVESNSCRYTCCFIFFISCMNELVNIWAMLQLLFRIPTNAEPWIQPRLEADGRRTGEIDDVRFLIAGMPLKWKIINISTILCPKIMIWNSTVSTGITFLMETSDIDDLIVNSVALALILGLDELIMNSLMHQEVSQMLSVTEDYALYDIEDSGVGDMSSLSEDELIELYEELQADFRHSFTLRDLSALFPYKFIISVCGTWIYVYQYYHLHCDMHEQRGVFHWVSKPIYLPVSTAFRWWNAFLPMFFPVPEQSEPSWEMPTA